MNSKNSNRRDIHQVTQQTTVSLRGMSTSMQLYAKQICDIYYVSFGSLIRTALAIQNLDGAAKLRSEHLQEAAQYLMSMEEE
jgi:hypothetical protein